MNDKHPNPVEKAKGYAEMRCEHNFDEDPFDTVANSYLAGRAEGHASRDEEVEELKAWKAEAMTVMPDFEKLGKLMGVKLGYSVHDKIIPYIEALKQRIKQLESSNIVFSQTIATEPVADPEDDIYDAVAQYRKDHSNDTEGANGPGC